MHIVHLLDESTGWEQRLGVSQLLDRLPKDRFACRIASIAPDSQSEMSLSDHAPVVLPCWPRIGPLVAPVVSRYIAVQGVQLIHAWGVRAAAAARAAGQMPLVVELFDPVVAKNQVTLLRTLSRPAGFAVLCTSEIVRRRLIEGGLSPELAVVIRPGVDFRRITESQRRSLRSDLGVGRNERLVVLPAPVTRAGGHFEAFWALAVHSYLYGGVRVIVPGTSPEQARIRRFARTRPERNPLLTAGDGIPFEQLLAVADILLITPRDDISTTCIAWAMAANVRVIGTAVYAVAEMIAHNVNGLLFKQTPGRSMTPAILKALEDRTAQERCREVARGQAYEVFGLRRSVEQHIRVYENLLSGRIPGDGITDSATTA